MSWGKKLLVGYKPLSCSLCRMAFKGSPHLAAESAKGSKAALAVVCRSMDSSGKGELPLERCHSMGLCARADKDPVCSALQCGGDGAVTQGCTLAGWVQPAPVRGGWGWGPGSCTLAACWGQKPQEAVLHPLRRSMWGAGREEGEGSTAGG